MSPLRPKIRIRLMSFTKRRLPQVPKTMARQAIAKNIGPATTPRLYTTPMDTTSRWCGLITTQNNKTRPELVEGRVLLQTSSSWLRKLRHWDLKRFTVDIVDHALGRLVDVAGRGLCRSEAKRNPRCENLLGVLELELLYRGVGSRVKGAGYQVFEAKLCGEEKLKLDRLYKIVCLANAEVGRKKRGVARYGRGAQDFTPRACNAGFATTSTA